MGDRVTGRPRQDVPGAEPLKDSGNLSHNVTIALSRENREALHARARAYGASASGVVRYLIMPLKGTPTARVAGDRSR